MNNEKLRNMYIKGFSISDIATTFGTTRQTVYNKKADDLKNGIDWDALALNSSRNKASLSENEFILTLINSYELAFNKIKELNPKDQLEILKEYTNTYYKLKAPLKVDDKAKILESISKAIEIIADIAKKENNEVVMNFLASNADEILARTLKQ